MQASTRVRRVLSRMLYFKSIYFRSNTRLTLQRAAIDVANGMWNRAIHFILQQPHSKWY